MADALPSRLHRELQELQAENVRLRAAVRESVQLHERLRALFDVERELARADTFDDFCRQVIELGRDRLGFDRLGLWFFTDDSSVLRGSFGTDESGRLRDERHRRIESGPSTSTSAFMRYQKPLVFLEDEPLGSVYENPVARGQNAIAAIWDGEAVIGLLCADNLLKRQPIGEAERDLLVLYAALVGYLCSQRRAREALLEREARYRRAIAAAEGVVYQIDFGSNTYAYLDERIESILGYPVEEITPDLFSRVCAYLNSRGEMVGLPRPEARRRFKVGEIPVWAADYAYVTRQGETRFLSDAAILLHDDLGNISGCLGILQDITDRKRLEEELFQAQKMESIGRLAGGVAHDFNNTLTVILGLAALARQEALPGSRTLGYLDRVIQSAERAAVLTSQLLAFARKQIVTPRVLDLNDLLRESETILRHLVGEHIALHVRPRGRSAWVRIDPGQLQQILMNLAGNARDAMPAGGTLTVETDAVVLEADGAARSNGLSPGDYVVLAVRDTGVGMSAEVQSHLFEPFFTTKQGGGGTGLGLASCYGIVKQNGGHIRVESAPGLGTTVRIYLPSARERPAEPASALTLHVPGGTETLLVAEDEPLVREMVEESLSVYGYVVMVAQDAEEALGMARSFAGRIDLLVTDIVMPGMNGIALAKQFQGARADAEVLFMTGYTEDLYLRQHLIDEHLAFLQKPFTPAALARKVREVLDRVRNDKVTR